MLGGNEVLRAKRRGRVGGEGRAEGADVPRLDRAAGCGPVATVADELIGAGVEAGQQNEGIERPEPVPRSPSRATISTGRL